MGEAPSPEVGERVPWERFAGWNGALGAGATATFGFLPSWNTTNKPPPAISCTTR